ncbi:MAG: DUF2283 domain-containing protein [Gemmatimonadetes bacterium]|jgi:hypothetical protein|nr:DUF2283 domain-containing protein [Gemmatimonadota bacterium]MBA4158985.1 DUF2283 domain-containing protein [Gemmatimonadota bacterium]
MKARYLEVTFRKGKMLAAYLYLPRASEVKSVRAEVVSPGLLVDYGADGQALGLEITAPGKVTLEEINAVLERLGQPGISADELAPLAAA